MASETMPRAVADAILQLPRVRYKGQTPNTRVLPYEMLPDNN